MPGMDCYSEAAVERAMKVQEVILRAIYSRRLQKRTHHLLMVKKTRRRLRRLGRRFAFPNFPTASAAARINQNRKFHLLRKAGILTCEEQKFRR
jgi:hypothetical protein